MARCRACGAGPGCAGLQDAPPALRALLQRHLHLTLSEEDGLPTTICPECREKLETFHEFYEQCTKIQATLWSKQEAGNELDIKPKSLNDYSLPFDETNVYLPKKEFKTEIKLELEEETSDYPCEAAELTELDDLFDDEYNDTSYDTKKKNTKRKIKSKAKAIKHTVNKRVDKNEKANINEYFNFDCGLCHYTCPSWYKLRSHSLKTHKVNPTVQCLRCKFSVRSKTTLYSHIADHKNPKNFACDKCPRITKSLAALEKHKMRHIPVAERTYQCDICSKNFKSKDSLKYHQTCHLPMEQRQRYPCTMCDMTFTTKSGLVGHKRAVHEKIKRYVCDLCGYACSTGNELKQHRAIHSDEKPYVCPICSKGFKTDSNLRVHVDGCDNNKSYECPICHRMLNSRRTFLKHKLVHETQCKHICTYCNKAFKRRQTLRAHLNGHTGDKPIKCKWCEERFMYGASYRTHKLRRHPDKLLNPDDGRSAQIVEVPKKLHYEEMKSEEPSPQRSAQYVH